MASDEFKIEKSLAKKMFFDTQTGFFSKQENYHTFRKLNFRGYVFFAEECLLID